MLKKYGSGFGPCLTLGNKQILQFLGCHAMRILHLSALLWLPYFPNFALTSPFLTWNATLGGHFYVLANNELDSFT